MVYFMDNSENNIDNWGEHHDLGNLHVLKINVIHPVTSPFQLQGSSRHRMLEQGLFSSRKLLQGLPCHSSPYFADFEHIIDAT